MQRALYGPDGYYIRHAALGGQGADYFTSPQLHPVFGALVGRFAWLIWTALGRPREFDLVEVGAGDGTLCADILRWAATDEPALFEAIRYTAIETSPRLRAIGAARSAGLGSTPPHWTQELPPPRSVRGFILANELLDALPVHLVAIQSERLLEQYVRWETEGPRLESGEPSSAAINEYFERLGLWPGEGCTAEVNLAGVRLAGQLASALDRGALLLVDYGYPAELLYAPHRRAGTLLCYRGHRVSSDPLRDVGQQDITTHVDFTSVARAGEAEGLSTACLISQAQLLDLLGLPLYRGQLRSASTTPAEQDAGARALAALVDPEGLGAIMALAQTRGCDLGTIEHSARSLPQPRWQPPLPTERMRLIDPSSVDTGDLRRLWEEMAATDDA
ncbi:MAG: class I SAM-dependent methyltransferase [Chloroflexota bacterium]